MYFVCLYIMFIADGVGPTIELLYKLYVQLCHLSFVVYVILLLLFFLNEGKKKIQK